ncbi:DUF1275 family protein [uncultured Dubosiella sp.]|uniref:DUF1275 family protein n=1 Tax=uncultured Dubosiella sp. TaxID=1937011 RepID=UPI00259B2428|nr:DUF1275 family protein [uncultured Dubosiella sp.]
MDEKRGLTTVAGLSLVGGFLETYTYRTRSGVFANAQTGNVLKMILIVLGERDGSLFFLRMVLDIVLYRRAVGGANERTRTRGM